ncbi:MAG: hypothetical protein ABH950_02220 [Candidatus Altiarchaeota archaeon]
MRRFFLFLAFFLVSSSFVSAFDFTNFSTELQLDFVFTVPANETNITLEIPFFFVSGSGMDAVERGVLDLLSSEYLGMSPQFEARSTIDVNVSFREVKVYHRDDSLETLAEINKIRGIVFLFGGPENNNLSGYFSNRSVFTNDSSFFYQQLHVWQGKTERGSSVIMVEHVKTQMSLSRAATRYSPLQGIVPDEYIPAVAVGTGVLLFYLLSVLQTVYEFKALDIGRRKKKMLHKKTKIWFFSVNLHEMLALLGASLVLGGAVTWTFHGPVSGFILKWMINSGLALFAALSHEIGHRLLGHFFGIKIEYKFWWSGSAITLLTGYLGHGFGIQGFLMEEVPPGTAKWKHGLAKLGAPLLSIAITIAFAYAYYLNPMPILQTIYITSSLWAMAEILPFKSLDGSDIRRWNHYIWAAAFLFIASVFVTVNLLL